MASRTSSREITQGANSTLRDGAQVLERAGGVAKPHIEAIITNHNTSALAEVALLSLASTTRSLDCATLNVTVTDNWSTDGVDRLKRTADLVGATFTTTRWPHAGNAASVTIDSLGDVWRDFVLPRDECDYYLFIDSDIEFIDDATVSTMLDTFLSHEGLWAVAADMVRSDSLPLDTVSGRLPRADEVLEFAVERTKGGRQGSSRKVLYGLSHPSGAIVPGNVDERVARPMGVAEEPDGGHLKCPSQCTLIARTDIFDTASRVIGFSPVLLLSGDTDLAGWYDDFALMTRVMQAAGYRYTTAATTVRHAFGATWAPEHYDKRATVAERTRQRLCSELSISI